MRAKKVNFNGRIYYQNPYGYCQAWDGHQLHRDIWESIHGPLQPDYIVHHIDHDRSNNSPENLQAIPWGEHSKIHWNARKSNPMQRICAYCGKDFQAVQLTAMYCSIQCNYNAYYLAHSNENKVKCRAYWAAHKDKINAERRAERSLEKKSLLQKVCSECGKGFQTVHPHAKYCSPVCKSKGYYRGHRAERLAYAKAHYIAQKEGTKDDQGQHTSIL